MTELMKQKPCQGGIAPGKHGVQNRVGKLIPAWNRPRGRGYSDIQSLFGSRSAAAQAWSRSKYPR